MHVKKKSIGSEAGRTLSFLYLGQILGAIITILTFIYVTRFLGPSNYGIYVFAIGFSALVSAVGNFGIGSYMSKNLSLFSYKKNIEGINRTISSSYILLFIVALILTLIGILISGVVSGVFISKINISYITLTIASCIIFFSMIQNVNVHALAGFSGGKQAAVTSITVDIIQLISIVALLLLGLGVNGAVLGILLGNIIGSMLSIFFILRIAKTYKGFRLFMPKKKMLSEVFNFSFPLAINNVLNTAMQNFSILFLGFYVTSAIIGNYGAALKGLNFATIAYGTMSMVVLPIFAKINASKKAKEIGNSYTKVMVYSLVLTLPFIIFVSAMAQPAVYLLLSNKYYLAPLFLTLITLGVAINMIAYYIGSILASNGLTKKMLKYNGVSVAIQLLLLMVLTPYFGVLGVILPVFILGGLMNDILLIMAVKNNVSAKINYKRIIACVVGALLLYIPLSIAFITSSIILQLILGFILSIVFYPIILSFLNIIGADDISGIRSFVPKVPFLSKAFDYILSYTNILIGIKNGR